MGTGQIAAFQAGTSDGVARGWWSSLLALQGVSQFPPPSRAMSDTSLTSSPEPLLPICTHTLPLFPGFWSHSGGQGGVKG